jgi:hypothetical protein
MASFVFCGDAGGIASTTPTPIMSNGHASDVGTAGSQSATPSTTSGGAPSADTRTPRAPAWGHKLHGDRSRPRDRSAESTVSRHRYFTFTQWMAYLHHTASRRGSHSAGSQAPFDWFTLSVTGPRLAPKPRSLVNRLAPLPSSAVRRSPRTPSTPPGGRCPRMGVDWPGSRHVRYRRSVVEAWIDGQADPAREAS